MWQVMVNEFEYWVEFYEFIDQVKIFKLFHVRSWNNIFLQNDTNHQKIRSKKQCDVTETVEDYLAFRIGRPLSSVEIPWLASKIILYEYTIWV